MTLVEALKVKSIDARARDAHVAGALCEHRTPVGCDRCERIAMVYADLCRCDKPITCGCWSKASAFVARQERPQRALPGF